MKSFVLMGGCSGLVGGIGFSLVQDQTWTAAFGHGCVAAVLASAAMLGWNYSVSPAENKNERRTKTVSRTLPTHPMPAKATHS